MFFMSKMSFETYLVLLFLASLIFIFLMPRGLWHGPGKRPWYRTFRGVLLITFIYIILVSVFYFWMWFEPLEQAFCALVAYAGPWETDEEDLNTSDRATFSPINSYAVTSPPFNSYPMRWDSNPRTMTSHEAPWKRKEGSISGLQP